jgi:Cupredoxin-like domain
MDHGRNILPTLALVPLLVCAFPLSARSGSSATIALQFKDHHFTPQNLVVPAGQPLAISVANASKETIEFESFKLNREKAITPGETITVRLPALSPGSYDFYDDFHQDVPQGTIVAK